MAELSDKKKTTTIVNLLRDHCVQPIVDANAVAGLLRQAVIDNSLAGQFSAGELTALQSFVADLSALAGSSVVTAIQNRYVPTHKARALVIEGVNDGT